MSTPDTPNALRDYANILHRRRIYLLTVIPAAILLAAYLAFALTPSYRSTATILLEASSIPAELVQTTVTSYADQQIELVSRRVLLPENLEPIVNELDPYPESPELTARQKARQIVADTIIERVDPITLEVLPESNAFSIHYHNSDPERAAAVAQKISNLFLDYNRRTRSERATATYDFLLTQSRDVERRMSEVDQRIAQFKARNAGALPEAQLRNQGSAERASRDLLDIEAQIRAAEERQALLNVQLSRINPSLGSTTGNMQTELATLQGQLAEARIRYTADHPDVKRLQRQIEALSAKAAADSGSAAVVANNPEYLAVKSQIQATQRELAALGESASRARSQIFGYEAGMAAAPAVEREFAELARSRDVLANQFADIQGKLREADVARNLETEQKGDRFSQIRSPGVSDLPFSPNRIGIILLGLVLGVAIAVGLAAAAESSDPTLRGAADIRGVTQVPTIASVPVLLNAVDRRRHLIWWGAYATILLSATAFVALTVVMA
jgi:polysaccharide chain length determinant protein (PEP-CTERM system associated)